MKTALVVLGGLALVVVAFIVWRLYATIVGGQRAYAKLRARIAPVTEALERGDTPSADDLLAFANDRVTRKVLYQALAEHDKVELFPREFLTWEALAEADLVAWLCHPNELGSPPDEIELTTQLPAPGKTSDPHRYFVFRYRTHPPHWAADDGWMAGVAGPYDVEQTPQPHAEGTFSRFEAYDSRTPEEHVAVTCGVAGPKG